jgi:methylated-DNA-[protein]-cysteine S-methyltransferase
MLKIFTIRHKLTEVRVITHNDDVVKIGFADHDYFLPWCEKHFRARPEPGAVDRRIANQLLAYLNGESQELIFPARLIATEFTIKVLKRLKRIPYGAARTYGEIATEIGRPKAARAVGAACRTNPLPLLYPCHRVLGKGGKLTGFASGVELKEKLLRLEGYPVCAK